MPGCHLKPNSFTPFWIEYHAGTFTIGTGRPGAGPRHCWTDAAPVEGLRHVGLSTWDRHVAYRQIQMQPPLQTAALPHVAEADTDFDMPDACLLQGGSNGAHPGQWMVPWVVCMGENGDWSRWGAPHPGLRCKAWQATCADI